MNAVEIKNLTFSYSKDKKIINNLSLEIKKGSFVTIIGHNGSGKSTLTKLLVGLLTKYEGEILINGTTLNQKTIKDIRKEVAIVFQNPDNQFIGATVEDDVAFGLENRNVPHQRMLELVNEYIAKVGMKDYMDKEPIYLSGGQKQRVAIAGALVLSPSILILDEATAMLDPKGKREIRELIFNMKKVNPDLTVISITHDIEEAYHSDEIVVLDRGQVVIMGDAHELFKNRDLLDKYQIDKPFVYEFLNSLKNHGIQLKDKDSEEEIINSLCQLM